MSTKKEKDTKDLEWEKRILCSDETCIGTIGQDGKCRECGLPYKGTLPDTFAAGESPESGQDTLEERDDVLDPPDEEPTASAGDDDDDEWSRRTLCSDETCIGVIGPDGRCKECGKPYRD